MAHSRFMSIVSPLLIALAACSSADPTDDGATDQDESSDALLGLGGPSVATCDAKSKADFVRDARAREQTFDLVINPGAAAELKLVTTWESFTATVVPADGGAPRTLATYPIGSPEDFGSKPYALIGNTSGSAQKYRVTIKRSAPAKSYFEVSCYPIVKDEKTPSGIEDERACVAGQPCTETTPRGIQSGTCGDSIFTNLADPARGGTTLGKCKSGS